MFNRICGGRGLMPDDSFMRFENHEDREKFLPILIEVYNYESTKVSGSTGGARRFSDCTSGPNKKCSMQ